MEDISIVKLQEKGGGNRGLCNKSKASIPATGQID